MQLNQRTIAIAAAMTIGFATAMFSASAHAEATVSVTPTTQSAESTDQQLQELRAQVQQLTANQKVLEQRLAAATTQPTNPAISEAAQAQAIQDVLADADRRSVMFDISGETAGYDRDKGFYLSSADGNYLIHPFVLLQVRNVTDLRESANTDRSDNTQNGFEIRRFQLGADGHAFTPDLTYRFFIQTSRETGEASLYDAWVRYRIDHGDWSIEAGQFKAPLDHEQLISDKTQLAADRTLTDDILAKGEAFSEGVMALYDDGGPLRARADFTNGYDVNDVNYQDYPTRAANFGLGGRVEYKMFGDWRDYDEFTAREAKQDQLIFGGGLDLTESGSQNQLRHVVDAQWLPGDGWSLYGAYLGMWTTKNQDQPTLPNTYDASLRAQVAYALPNTKWEPFLRYDYLYLDGKEFTAGTHSTVHEITAGTNYYFFGQNLKATFDLTYLPNGSPVEDTGNGILADNGRAEFVIRGQVQLAL